MEALTAAEQDQITPLLPTLEGVARRMVRRGKHAYEENYSSGFEGLVHFVRTPPTGDPEQWLEICISNAIRLGRRTDHRYTDRAQPYEDHAGPVQVDQPQRSLIYDLVDELPAYLRDVCHAMLSSGGDKRGAARILGISPGDLGERLEIIRERMSRN